MRLTGLLALLLFIVIVFFAAPAASFAQTVATPVPSTAKADFDRQLAELARRGDAQIEKDGVCYTMRTYIMAREDKNSDTTHMVRATRCLPAWKLELKTAGAEPVAGSQNVPATMR
jgi:hypothetical protein